MCTIALKTKFNQIPDNIIDNLFYNNPDGAGIMYAKDGTVYWEKGFFSVEDLKKAWHKVPIDCVGAIHCRIATHGKVDTPLCHPFALTKDSTMYEAKGSAKCCLMHNGVMHFMEKSKYYDKKKDSDSSAFAKLYFDFFGAKLPNEQQSKFIEENTVGNRLLFLDGKGSYELFGTWEYNNGIYYSNGNWEEKHYKYPSLSTSNCKSVWEGYDDEYDAYDQEWYIANQYGLMDMYDYDVFDGTGKQIDDTDNLFTDGDSIYEYVKGEMVERPNYYAIPIYEEDGFFDDIGTSKKAQ